MRLSLEMVPARLDCPAHQLTASSPSSSSFYPRLGNTQAPHLHITHTVALLLPIKLSCFSVFWIRIGLNTDTDPAFEVNTDPDPAFEVNTDLDPAFEVNTNPDPGFFMTLQVTLFLFVILSFHHKLPTRSPFRALRLKSNHAAPRRYFQRF